VTPEPELAAPRHLGYVNSARPQARICEEQSTSLKGLQPVMTDKVRYPTPVWDIYHTIARILSGWDLIAACIIGGVMVKLLVA
jgi:hypothetical protein